MSKHTPSDSGRWQFWIDRGGTFTDLVARTPDGRLRTHKLLSENPARYADAAIQGIRDLLGLAPEAPLPVAQIGDIKMGTTVATNALLERRGEPTLLLTTQGFADALRIGYQTRPRLFDLDIRLPPMIYAQVATVDERMGAHGEVLQAPDETALRATLQEAFDAGLRAVAICFLHGYRYPAHERLAAQIAAETGFTQISVSHETSPLMGLIGRGDTTVVDAYLSPVLRRYVNQVAGELEGLAAQGGRLMFMQSGGGLTDAAFFRGKDAILSGPAGGVVGMVRTAEAAGFEKVVGFDMGGTSTDVSHYNGELERTFEAEVAGVRLRAPMMQIHTVAAGGGSVLHFDGARLRVGPDSAGAYPGPACYRNGGPLTVTDCNVMLGKLDPAFFPAVFGADGKQSLDTRIVREKFTALAAEISEATGTVQTPESVAEGFLTVAVQNMANAIKKISVERGYDVSDYTLVSFGGAGGQHACLVADALGIKRVFLHPHAGVLSAFGIGLADVRHLEERALEQTLSRENEAAIGEALKAPAAAARDELQRQGFAADAIAMEYRARLRYDGSDTALTVPFGSPASMQSAFEEQHAARFGFISPEKQLIVQSLQAEAIVHSDTDAMSADMIPHGTELPPALKVSPRSDDATAAPWRFYQREQLSASVPVPGPAIILEPTGTNVVEPGWQAERRVDGALILTRQSQAATAQSFDTAADPVMLEIFNNLFMNVAEQMGTVLQNTAASVNIKERLDFSCAIFDPDGELIANAPHMPVHLGSMSESIKAVIRKHGDTQQPGDVFVLNAPYNGGTHLPDVTVIKPVFEAAEVIFYVASRGHHADIGGAVPGSFPADSRSVDEEGILLDNVLLVHDGRFLEEEMRVLLAGGRWPARKPDYNIADLKAQVAAVEKGATELLRVIGHYSLPVVHAYMRHVQDNAEASVRRVLSRLGSGSFSCSLDDAYQVSVSVTVDPAQATAVIDFTGTSGQHPGNFNAPRAVCYAAVLYVFRCLVDEDIPLNAGCLKPLQIILPEPCLINPVAPAAVVAGNVETSQLIVDALFGALGIMAAAQGTMNNFIWGNGQYQYYETLCGGAGATARADGCDAVHTHMTNSRLTDPEVLEWRFPVRLERFAIRRGSGGRGKYKGGDGIIRRVRFGQAMSVNIIANRRKVAPYGMAGGEPGQVGVNRLIRADGTEQVLSGTVAFEVAEGDIVEIETPGGGGYGRRS
ncbi:hydantoinase B/oxoprolinase family protein [Granulosicoccaceae sp. 1_MG-2023]|nr:hydantoinase B/oxoprolinase family protein [Granulosicoccaceae sp. 1_MG-2023]